MPDWAIAALVALVFLAFVAGLNALLMWFSGWYALGKLYQRPPHKTPEQRRRGVSGKVGRVASNGAFAVGADDGGLYLSYIGPWKFLAPALYIPWSALHFERRWKFLWIRKARYRTAIGIPIELHGAAADLAANYEPTPE